MSITNCRDISITFVYQVYRLIQNNLTKNNIHSFVKTDVVLFDATNLNKKFFLNFLILFIRMNWKSISIIVELLELS